jgi:hypothetical protein
MTPAPRVLLHVGVSGSGKTFALQEDACERIDAGRRALIIDTAREWNASPHAIDPVYVETLDAARESLRRGTRMVVLRVARPTTLGPAPKGEVPLIERACALALDERAIDLVVTEAHMHLAGDDAVGVQTRTLITQYRHYGCALAVDTQRFAALATRVRAQASAMRLFALVGSRDLVAVDEVGGPALVAAVQACNAKLAAGEAGWHVYIDPKRPPLSPRIERY